jgi:hypothetical protein
MTSDKPIFYPQTTSSGDELLNLNNLSDNNPLAASQEKIMLEIVMTLAGIYALISGRIPEWIAGKGYRIQGWPARGLGLLMMSSIPLSIFVLAALIFMQVPNAEDLGFLIEVSIVLIIALTAAINIRRIREPIQPEEIWPPERPGS